MIEKIIHLQNLHKLQSITYEIDNRDIEFNIYHKDEIISEYRLKGYTNKEVAIGKYSTGKGVEEVILKYDRDNRLLHIYEFVCSELARKSGYNSQRVGLAYRESNGNVRECAEITKFKEKLHTLRAFGSIGLDDIHSISDITIKSKNYTLSRIFNRHIDSVFKYTKDIWMSNLKDIMLFDIVVGNKDRHADNIGLLRIGNKLELSPLFDNGNSFANSQDNPMPNIDDDLFYFSKTPYTTKNKRKPLTEIDLIDELSEYYTNITKELLRTFDKVLTAFTESRIREELTVYRRNGKIIADYITKYIQLKYKFYKEYYGGK